MMVSRARFRKRFIAALVGTGLVALCCFTPLLVIGLGLAGLSFVTPYLDFLNSRLMRSNSSSSISPAA